MMRDKQDALVAFLALTGFIWSTTSIPVYAGPAWAWLKDAWRVVRGDDLRDGRGDRW